MIQLPPPIGVERPRLSMPHAMVAQGKRGRLQTTAARYFEAQSLLARLGERSGETASHTRRVADLMGRMCVHLGLPRDVQDALFFGAVLHDIGKLYVRQCVLHKPAALNDEEWQEMKLHPSAGAIISDQRDFDLETSAVILHHHERYDGAGYPHKLAGEAIPLGARIFSIVDTYDAVTSDRCYRAARPDTVAIKILREEAGKQFDPVLVEAFAAVWMQAKSAGRAL